MTVFISEHEVGEGATGIYRYAVTHPELYSKTPLALAHGEGGASFSRTIGVVDKPTTVSFALAEPVTKFNRKVPGSARRFLNRHGIFPSPVSQPLFRPRRSWDRFPFRAGDEAPKPARAVYVGRAFSPPAASYVAG
jgi:hypothetical protein